MGYDWIGVKSIHATATTHTFVTVVASVFSVNILHKKPWLFTITQQD